MRVLFVTEEPIRFSGTMVRGGQIHVRNVILGLRERGHDVHLVDWNSESERQFQHSLAPRSRFVEGPVQTLRKLVSIGKSAAPDVIVSKTRKVYIPGLLAGRILGVPHIAHVGSSLDPPTNGPLDRLDSESFAARLRAPHAAYFVVCDAIGNELRERGVASERVYDVRNAVDATRFVPDPEVSLPDRVRSRIGDTAGPILGVVGGLTDYKGVFDLADAIERSRVDPTVVVAGDGPARGRFERELGENGLFLGSIDYELMPAVYANINALVLPSHTEGLPRVLLEAGAAARPVVASAVGGVPGVVVDGETGLLCPPRDPSRLAAAIDELFTERQPTKMGQRARELIVEEYTWDAQYNRYEAFLADVVSM